MKNDHIQKETVYCRDGLWYFNAKNVDLGHFEVIYSLEGGFADKESAIQRKKMHIFPAGPQGCPGLKNRLNFVKNIQEEGLNA